MPRHLPPGLAHVAWGVCAAVVAAFVLLAALAVIEPDDVIALTIVVFALAAALLAHEWREQFKAERR